MLKSTPSDTKILNYIKNQDTQAITDILGKYGDALYGIAYRRLKSETVATEVMQMTFVIFWQELAHFEQENEQLFNYLLRIMNRVILNKQVQKAA